MKQLIEVICSIYMAIGVALALALLGSLVGAGIAQMHPWVLWAALGLYFFGAAFGFMFHSASGDSQPIFMKSLIGPLVVSMLLTIGLGFATQLGDQETSSRAFQFDELIRDYMPTLTEALIFVASLAPLLSIFAARTGFTTSGSELDIAHRSKLDIVHGRKVDIVEMAQEFLRWPGNHLLFIGPVRTGKSWVVSKLVNSNAIASDKFLGFSKDITLDLDSAKNQMLNLVGPIAFDEVQVLSHAGVLLPALKLANSINKSYIVAAQSIFELPEHEVEEIFKANAVKIIYFEQTVLDKFEDIKWREVSRYQAQSLCGGAMPNVA